MIKFILDRLKERTTWAGILALVTAAGVSLNPEQSAAIVSAGVSVVGLALAFLPDKKA